MMNKILFLFRVMKECIESKSKYAVSCRLQYYEQNPYIGKTLVQKHGDKYLIQNPPMPPLETDELDEVYALPYMKNYHPMYEKDGGIPAIQEVKFSLACQTEVVSEVVTFALWLFIKAELSLQEVMNLL